MKAVGIATPDNDCRIRRMVTPCFSYLVISGLPLSVSLSTTCDVSFCAHEVQGEPAGELLNACDPWKLSELIGKTLFCFVSSN